MIKLFRNVRKQLLGENRFSKYLLYAIGEIILVVIGILIAIQLDSWRTERKNEKTEISYLHSILEELKVDSLSHINGWERRYPQKIEGLNLAKDFLHSQPQIEDSIAFINKVGLGGMGGIGNMRLNNRTYLDLINTGNFGLIQQDDIRNQISYYYSYLDFTMDYLDKLRTDYPRKLNSLRPFDPNNVDKVDKRDIKHFFESIKQNDILDLINQELTFAHSADNRYNDSHRICSELIDSIRAYLKKIE
ncbi:DUF6090 family protein [uncultured Maribacter sp.]|uniref:DUF6090 family protein n=1 Tax=uncultured Maribacter sp. TaxID=431308 RepID=UPI0030DBBFD3|tara:strand:- start:3211 stop:3951 length:741 start_codon:yes stop_codon:yes gene_type:complete